MLYHYVLYLRRIRFFLQSCGGVDGKYDVRITKDDVNMVPHGGEVGLCGLALWWYFSVTYVLGAYQVTSGKVSGSINFLASRYAIAFSTD